MQLLVKDNVLMPVYGQTLEVHTFRWSMTAEAYAKIRETAGASVHSVLSHPLPGNPAATQVTQLPLFVNHRMPR